MSILNLDIMSNNKTNTLIRTYRKNGILNGNKWKSISYLPTFITGGILSSFSKRNLSLEEEVDFLITKGYQPQFQTENGGNTDFRKVIGGAIIAGTIGAFIGAKQSQKEITITFIKK